MSHQGSAPPACSGARGGIRGSPRRYRSGSSSRPSGSGRCCRCSGRRGRCRCLPPALRRPGASLTAKTATKARGAGCEHGCAKARGTAAAYPHSKAGTSSPCLGNVGN
eukprot:scaffold106932_cov64-Phaeocystis_antarctica.AAC.4